MARPITQSNIGDHIVRAPLCAFDERTLHPSLQPPSPLFCWSHPALHRLLYETICHAKSEPMPSRGKRLQQCRLAAGLSQSELARRTGVSRQALGAMEAGVYQPGVGVALRVARLLGESVEVLFGDAGDEPTLVEATWAG